MLTRKWAKEALERMIRFVSFCVGGMIIAPLGGAAVTGNNLPPIQSYDWEYILGAAGTGAILSLVVSVAATKKGDPESTSLLK